jgi:hypothetical protein
MIHGSFGTFSEPDVVAAGAAGTGSLVAGAGGGVTKIGVACRGKSDASTCGAGVAERSLAESAAARGVSTAGALLGAGAVVVVAGWRAWGAGGRSVGVGAGRVTVPFRVKSLSCGGPTRSFWVGVGVVVFCVCWASAGGPATMQRAAATMTAKRAFMIPRR